MIYEFYLTNEIILGDVFSQSGPSEKGRLCFQYLLVICPKKKLQLNYCCIQRNTQPITKRFIVKNRNNIFNKRMFIGKSND